MLFKCHTHLAMIRIGDTNVSPIYNFIKIDKTDLSQLYHISKNHQLFITILALSIAVICDYTNQINRSQAGSGRIQPEDGEKLTTQKPSFETRQASVKLFIVPVPCLV